MGSEGLIFGQCFVFWIIRNITGIYKETYMKHRIDKLGNINWRRIS